MDVCSLQRHPALTYKVFLMLPVTAAQAIMASSPMSAFSYILKFVSQSPAPPPKTPITKATKDIIGDILF